MVTVELVVEMPGIFPAKNFFTSGVQNRNPTFCVPAIFPSVRLERFFDALDQIRSGLSFWWWCLQSDNCTHLFSYIQRQTTFSGEVRLRSFKLSAPSLLSHLILALLHIFSDLFFVHPSTFWVDFHVSWQVWPKESSTRTCRRGEWFGIKSSHYIKIPSYIGFEKEFVR